MVRYFCEQCGEELENGDETVWTGYHFIHEDCEDDYIDMMKSSWTYETFWKEEKE